MTKKKAKKVNTDILFDPPIKSHKEDRLGRAPIAKRVATMLSDVKTADSFVVGVEGEWGSGKTSFVLMILEELMRSPSKFDVIRFNPWNFSSPDALYIDFFKRIGSEIKDIDGGLNYAKILGAVNSIEIDPLSLVPGVKLDGPKIKIKGGKSLETQRKEFEEKLLKRKKKILVVIDDIDRLDKRQTREVFKLVKMNADFPNVTYLLAYDRPKIEKILNEEGFPGSEYLKKIVQISFSLPRPEQQQIHEILFDELNKTLDGKELEAAMEKYWDAKRWGNLFNAGFKDVFVTIRDIKRYISSWRLDYAVVGYGEVNPVDFLGLEIIRVFAPEVFQLIGENKDLFTEHESLYPSYGRNNKEGRKELYKSIIEKAPVNVKDSIDSLCKELFPQTKGFLGNSSYPYSYQQEWRSELRVCAKDVFDIYFLLTIPTSKISQAEMDGILGNFDDPDKIESEMQKIKDLNKRKSLLDMTFDKLKSLNESQSKNLLEVMYRVGEVASDERRAFELEGTVDKIGRLCYHIIKKTEEKRFEFVKNSIKSTESLYMPWYIVGLILKEHEEKETSDSDLFSEFTNKQVSEIKNILIDRIEKQRDSNKLISNQNLGALLIWWNKWTKRDVVKKYILSLFKTKSGFFSLVNAFKLARYSQQYGDSVSTTSFQIDVKSIDNLVGYAQLEKAYKKYSKLSKLNKEQRDLVAILKDGLKGFSKHKEGEN